MAKILVCSMNYRPEIISTGRYSTELAEYLVTQGHRVEVVTTAPHYPGWNVFSPYNNRHFSQETLNGVRVWRGPMYLNTKAAGLARLVMPFTFALGATPLLLWRGLMWRPNVVLVVQPTIFAAPSALLAAALGGAGIVQHVQDLEIDAALAVGHVRSAGWAKRAIFAIERFVTRRFDGIVTISHAMRSRLIAKGVDPDRIVILRNWVDTACIRPLERPSSYRASLGIPDDVFVVQYSGQLGKKQALPLLTTAARALRDDPRFLFVVAGDGPLLPFMQQEAAALPNLRLLPLQPTDMMGEFLGLADCHILPQDADVGELVLPSKLGGMLASGRRILITADQNTELYQFVGGKAATFVPAGDAEAIADALRIMIDTADEGAAERAARLLELEARVLLPQFEHLMLAFGSRDARRLSNRPLTGIETAHPATINSPSQE